MTCIGRNQPVLATPRAGRWLEDGEQASASDGDPRDAWEDVVAGSALDSASGRSCPILGGDRSWRIERGCGRRGRGVIRGWDKVVPGGWRDAVALVGSGVGPLS